MRNGTPIAARPLARTFARPTGGSRSTLGPPVLMVVVLAASLLSACGVSPTARDDIEVRFAGANLEDATEVHELEGAVLVDTIELYVDEDPRFTQVRFHLDDPDMEREPSDVEFWAPYTMELDTHELTDGVHTLTVVADVSSGDVPVVTRTFTVANDTDGVVPGTEGDDVEGDEGDDGDEEGASGDEGDDEGVGDDGQDAEAVPAATLYVAPDGSDANDGRSASSPVTIRRATEIAGPGDVIHLSGGTYPIDVQFSKSGSPDAPIVWTSRPGEWAVFDGSGHAPISSSAKFHVIASWNVFLNLEVRDGPQEGIFVDGGDDNVFRGIVTHGHQYSGIGNVGGDRNLFEGIATYDNYDDHNPRGLYGDDADGIALSSGDSNVIRGVVAYANSDDGIDAWRSTNTVIEGVIAFDNGRGSHGNGNGIKAGGASEWNATIVRNSIAYGNRGNGFDDNSGRGIAFENNTAFDNAGYSFTGGTTTRRRNNIAVGGSVGMWGADDAYNSWDLGIHDPRFVSTDPDHPQFLTLDPSSPALAAGAGSVALGAIPADGSVADMVGPVARAAAVTGLLTEADPSTANARAALR